MKKFDSLTEAFHNMREVDDNFSREAREKNKKKTNLNESKKRKSLNESVTNEKWDTFGPGRIDWRRLKDELYQILGSEFSINFDYESGAGRLYVDMTNKETGKAIHFYFLDYGNEVAVEDNTSYRSIFSARNSKDLADKLKNYYYRKAGRNESLDEDVDNHFEQLLRDDVSEIDSYLKDEKWEYNPEFTIYEIKENNEYEVNADCNCKFFIQDLAGDDTGIYFTVEIYAHYITSNWRGCEFYIQNIKGVSSVTNKEVYYVNYDQTIAYDSDKLKERLVRIIDDCFYVEPNEEEAEFSEEDEDLQESKKLKEDFPMVTDEKVDWDELEKVVNDEISHRKSIVYIDINSRIASLESDAVAPFVINMGFKIRSYGYLTVSDPYSMRMQVEIDRPKKVILGEARNPTEIAELIVNYINDNFDRRFRIKSDDEFEESLEESKGLKEDFSEYMGINLERMNSKLRVELHNLDKRIIDSELTDQFINNSEMGCNAWIRFNSYDIVTFSLYLSLDYEQATVVYYDKALESKELGTAKSIKEVAKIIVDYINNNPNVLKEYEFEESLKESKNLKEDFPIISRLDWDELERLINKGLKDVAKEVDGFYIFQSNPSWDKNGRAVVPFQVELDGRGRWFTGFLAADKNAQEIEVFIYKKVPTTSLGITHNFSEIVDLLVNYINENYDKH